jgi:hypothetical protein
MTKLRDDLMVVIPAAVVGEGGARPWTQDKVKELCRIRDEVRTDTCYQSRYPKTYSFLLNFESDPETVIRVRAFDSSLGGCTDKTIRELREMRSRPANRSEAYGRLLDSFEIRDEESPFKHVGSGPTKDMLYKAPTMKQLVDQVMKLAGEEAIPPMPRSFITEENAIRVKQVKGWEAITAKRMAEFAQHDHQHGNVTRFVAAFTSLYEQDYREKQKVTVSAGEMPPIKSDAKIERRVMPLPTSRLERVAAGLEADPYVQLGSSELVSKLGKVKGINEKPPLTIQADDQTGEDVCGDPRRKL